MVLNKEQNVHQLLSQVWDELPQRFGERWHEIEPKLWELLRQIESGELDAVDAILQLLGEGDGVPQLIEESAKELGTTTLVKAGFPAGTVKTKLHVEIPVMFGTDRARDLGGYANTPNQGELQLGQVLVSVPADHRMGELESPPWWKLGFGWDPDKHIMVLDIQDLDRAAFLEHVGGLLRSGGEKTALVFIHGFNVSFEEAARRAAQIAYDLQYQGLMAFYSWPSADVMSKSAYLVDSDKVKWSQTRLQEYLELLMTELNLDAVHLLAHSMGNRALTEVLKDLVHELPPKAADLGEVIFAAPDLNVQTFRALAAKFHQLPQRCTLYASSKDVALKISKRFNNSVRAGDAGANLTMMEGIDTVDASAVDTSLSGHSYYGDNRSIITDLILLIKQRMEADLRPSLEGRGIPPHRYWVFRP